MQQMCSGRCDLYCRFCKLILAFHVQFKHAVYCIISFHSLLHFRFSFTAQNLSNPKYVQDVSIRMDAKTKQKLANCS